MDPILQSKALCNNEWKAGWAPELIWMWWLREKIPSHARKQNPVIQPLYWQLFQLTFFC
jgi:hypothetical protein